MRTLIVPDHQLHAGNLILVNEKYGMTQNRPDMLVPVGSFENIFLKRQAAVLLEQLLTQIDGWKSIVLVSGFRSLEEQQQIWDDTIKESGYAFTRKFVAVPGHSEHQTGLAIDLGLKKDKIDFICPDFPDAGICGRFRDFASDYGFVERYPAGKEEITGIGHEPWHFRYVGVPHAKVMREKNFTLEEYIVFLKQYCRSERSYTVTAGDHEIGISYVPAQTGGQTVLRLDETLPYSISGNNADGYIITEWRRAHAQQEQKRRA